MDGADRTARVTGPREGLAAPAKQGTRSVPPEFRTQRFRGPDSHLQLSGGFNGANQEQALTPRRAGGGKDRVSSRYRCGGKGPRPAPGKAPLVVGSDEMRMIKEKDLKE